MPGQLWKPYLWPLNVLGGNGVHNPASYNKGGNVKQLKKIFQKLPVKWRVCVLARLVIVSLLETGGNKVMSRVCWRVKSPATRQFVPRPVQANRKPTLKLRIIGPLRRTQRFPVYFPHKGPVMQKIFPCHDIIMNLRYRDHRYQCVWIGGIYYWANVTFQVRICRRPSGSFTRSLWAIEPRVARPGGHSHFSCE